MKLQDLNERERSALLCLRRNRNKATNHQLAADCGHRFGARIFDLRQRGFDIPRPRKPKEGELGPGPAPEGITVYELKGFPEEWEKQFVPLPPPTEVPLPMGLES